MMKALSIQIQPERVPGLKMKEVQVAFEAIAGMSPLVEHHQFDDGFDKTRYFNFTFGTEDLERLWAVIRSTIYRNPALAEPIAKSSIVVCTGENGWDDYLLLFHFDPSVPCAEINAAMRRHGSNRDATPF
jgi:hypothetical protein